MTNPDKLDERSRTIASALGINQADLFRDLRLPIEEMPQADQLLWLFSQLSDAADQDGMLTLVRAFVALVQARRRV